MKNNHLQLISAPPRVPHDVWGVNGITIAGMVCGLYKALNRRIVLPTPSTTTPGRIFRRWFCRTDAVPRITSTF